MSALFYARPWQITVGLLIGAVVSVGAWAAARDYSIEHVSDGWGDD